MRLCSIPGCGRKHFGRGFCSSHYSKSRIYGDPLFSKIKLIELNGVKKTIAEWARGLGLDATSLRQRLRSGWSVEVALTVPRHRAVKQCVMCGSDYHAVRNVKTCGRVCSDKWLSKRMANYRATHPWQTRRNKIAFRAALRAQEKRLERLRAATLRSES